MKRLFTSLLALITSAAFGTTTVPVQLLNPAGSTSGQAIVSTGPSSAPAWSGIPISAVTGLGTGVATGLGNSSTGTGGPVFSTSPTITTPNITGVTTGSAGSAGTVGEVNIGNGTTVNIPTSATATNCTSINLSAGDWILFGYITYAQGSGSFSPTQIWSSISTTSATQGSSPMVLGIAFTANFTQSLPVPEILLTVSVPTTVYLVGQATFPSGTPTMTCKLTAMRFH